MKAPKEVRCEWKFTKEHGELKDVHVCGMCGSWTANEPYYRFTVCPLKDRRKSGTDDRRRPAHVVVGQQARGSDRAAKSTANK